MEIKDKELHRVAITAIIYNSDRKYLITRRSLAKKVFPGKWTVPGGGLSVDDYIHTPPTHDDNQWYHTVQKTLEREVKEEVNLTIGKAEYLLDLTLVRPDGTPVLVLSYFAPFISGEVKLSKEDIEFAWVSVEEAKNYDLINGIYEELEEVEKILKS